MKKVFFTLIFVVVFINNAVAKDVSRYVNDCLAVIDQPKLKITSSYGKLKYNFDKDEDFLRKETIKKFATQGDMLSIGYKPLGLTVVRQGFEFDMEVGVVSVSDGMSCFYPKNIKAHVGYYVPTIYILKYLEKDTCMYDVALRHEKTHMEIYIHALDYFMPVFKKAAEGLLGRVGVKIADNDGAFEKKAMELYENYKSRLQSEFDNWRKSVEEEQSKLDSMDNYTLETRICNEIDKK